jgi:hypothetical protein
LLQSNHLHFAGFGHWLAIARFGEIHMSEVVENAPQEFWRPPVAEPETAVPTMVEVCDRCETEFMIGARFCHDCGAERQPKITASAGQTWTRILEFLHILEFHNVKQWLGLPMASLISFFAGLGCLLAAVAVGLIYSVQTLADFQAIQSWRTQWLLAALVAFVAGILLKQAGVKAK